MTPDKDGIGDLCIIFTYNTLKSRQLPPPISIIVPVYNAAGSLARCVGSVLSQTLTDWELLLVDDGSPDCSGEMCDRYAATDPRITAIHKANGGAASARNAGLDTAKGKYICFIDSDDHVTDTFLEDFTDGQEADMAICGKKIKKIFAEGI